MDVSTVGKRFLETFADTKRVVSLVATRSMAPLGLGRAQIALLRALGRSDPSTQRALADATMLDPSATTRSLTMLSKRGWIRRRRGEIDRRESYVELTPRGRRLAARVDAHYAAIAAILGSRLDDRDVADLERIFTKLSPLTDPPSTNAPRREPRRRGGVRRRAVTSRSGSPRR